jgi:hypothetical protein
LPLQGCVFALDLAYQETETFRNKLTNSTCADSRMCDQLEVSLQRDIGAHV